MKTPRACLVAVAVAAILVPGSRFSAQAPAPAAAGPTTIHDAAVKGDLATVKRLLAQDPALLEAEKPPNKKTALHYAAQNGRRDVVEFLLDSGAQVNRPNIAGETALHYAVGLESPDVVNLLLARGADVKAKTDAGMTPLRGATAWGRLGAMRALLDKGADARETTPSGQTLLHMSALIGPPEAIGLLVTRGADMNAAAKNGDTPLLVACTAGNQATAAALIEHGADPNKRGGSGREPLTSAVRSGQSALVKRLLDAGAKPAEATTADKLTALHFAAAIGRLDITKMLLAAGASRDARDSQGRTAIELASRHGNRRVADALGGAAAPGAAATPAGPEVAAGGPKPGEAVVWYLGNLGWAVRTANHFLIFDYDGRTIPPDEPSLANGSIDPAEIKDMATTVFISHGHADHYAPAAFGWRATVRNITYVAGFKPEGKDGYVFMAPRETKTLGGLDITTTLANDEGVGFFVRVDGVTIFHSGDHSAEAGDDSFKPEIDFLADRGLRADLLFMPISPFGSQAASRGVHYAMTRLSARSTFPGHVDGREHVCGEFAKDAVKAAITAPILCPEFGGDRFTVPAPESASNGVRR